MKLIPRLAVSGGTLALSATLNAAPDIEVFDGAAVTDPPLTDGQAAVVDFGCTKLNSPVVRPFTVQNAGDETLVIPAESLTLPNGYSLSGGWPQALVAPEVLVEVDKDDSGTAIEPRMYGVFIKNMPSSISVTSVKLTIPDRPAGPDAARLPVAILQSRQPAARSRSTRQWWRTISTISTLARHQKMCAVSIRIPATAAAGTATTRASTRTATSASASKIRFSPPGQSRTGTGR